MGSTIQDLVPNFPDENDPKDNFGVTEVPLTPATPRTTAQLVNCLLENTPNGQKLYRTPSGDRLPTKTRVIHDQTRVRVCPMRIEVPYKKGKQQATNGEVKAFKPNVFKECCKRKCCALFPNESPQLKKARGPLFDSALDRGSTREALLTNADLLLRHPQDEMPVCNGAKALLYSCSRSMLFPQLDRYDGRTTGDSNRARTKTAVSVCSWFEERKILSDIMPDTGIFQLSEPTRGFVKSSYDFDVATVKACSCDLSRHEPCDCEDATPLYTKCSPAYFNSIWDEHFPDVKTRKWCRFSKCTLCIQMRALRDKHRQNKYVSITNRRILKHTHA